MCEPNTDMGHTPFEQSDEARKKTDPADESERHQQTKTPHPYPPGGDRTVCVGPMEADRQEVQEARWDAKIWNDFKRGTHLLTRKCARTNLTYAGQHLKQTTQHLKSITKTVEDNINNMHLMRCASPHAGLTLHISINSSKGAHAIFLGMQVRVPLHIKW